MIIGSAGKPRKSRLRGVLAKGIRKTLWQLAQRKVPKCIGREKKIAYRAKD